MVAARVHYDPSRLAAACRSHGVSRLALFGSVLRDDFGPASDGDMLVEFAPGRTPGLSFFTLQQELSDLIGRTVDLNTPEDLPDAFRDDVLRAAEVRFEAR